MNSDRSARPARCARSVAAAIAGSERSTPTTRAAEAGPGQGVHAEVALEVHEVEIGDVARLLHLVGPQGRPPGQEPVHPVEVAGHVGGDPLVPEAPVLLEPLVVHDGHSDRRTPRRARDAQRPPHPREGRSAVAAGEGWAGGNSPRWRRAYGPRSVLATMRRDATRSVQWDPAISALQLNVGRRWVSRSSIRTRSWAIVSRSRTVTERSSKVSKSTVRQNGVPTSSWRR